MSIPSQINITRYSKNPILIPRKDNWWESQAVFNCSTCCDGDSIHMFYRAIGEYESYISRIGYASSTDGFQFVRRRDVAIPITEEYEKYGMEDPRITQIGNQIYVSYVVLSDYVKKIPKVYSAIAKTYDCNTFNKLGIVSDKFEDNKDFVLFPEKFHFKDNFDDVKREYYLSLHRPGNWIGSDYGTTKPSIWLRKSSTIFNMQDGILLLKPEQDWEELKIGTGPPPIKTDKGWLLIYHGVDKNKVYRAGAAILDLKDPTNVISRTKKPFLEPVEKYEKTGDVSNVVFPTGLTTLDGKLLLYYGGADKVCCVASVDLDEFLEYILQDRVVN
jgi:predicted GH43/DUF377 family glycosyl hydrolase